jgi:hypothetical protein
MLAGLQTILEKQVVLSTINANDLLHDPSKVESDYQKHVETFIPMGDVGEFSSKLSKNVLNTKTPKGLLVAPYGFGKTSTLAFLWRECERQGLVAIPPFYCASLLDILNATYGWARFRLQKREPALLSDLEDIHDKYTTATVKEMAERYAEEHGIAKVTSIGLLNDMLGNGNLVLELQPMNLLFFLDGVTNLLVRAGFNGLVVLPDEFQQYFSKGANLRRSIQEFREFVWGLDTRSNALGVVFSVPTYAESIIQEQGKDILHRLKKDGLYYRLQDIYTRDFPIRLWKRYVDTFNLKSINKQVIEENTLEAIGQISERDDLGEGPRTVIDSFKRAILHYQDHEKPYSPIDLIDDFLESNINFQAQTNKLKTVTRQALDSAIINSSERKQAIKLLAAFPRGCSPQIQRDYQLYDTVNALSKQAHGELMTHLVEGYTLLGLSRTGGPTQTVDIIITRYWQSFEEDDLHMESAIRAFNNRLLPRFFERRRGATATGWGDLSFSPTPHGSYLALVEGSFNPQYPRRQLALQVAYQEEQLLPLNADADLQFDFLFHKNGLEATGSLLFTSERQACFNLNIQQKVGPTLPQDLRKLQDFVNPEFVTPLLMLGLVDYFERWEEIEEQPIPEGDRQEIEHFIGRLISHSVQMLFNQEMATSISPPIRRIGGLMFEEVFNRLCRSLYQRYHTFLTHAQYDKVIDDYIKAMQGMTLKERRGHAVISDTKEVLARQFGLSSVATFDNRLESEYANLAEKVQWVGRGDQSQAEIKLKLHPLEETILEKLRQSGDRRDIDGRMTPILSSNEVAHLARDFGYRDDETVLALQLLAARGYTRFDPASKIVYLAQIGVDPQELNTRLEKLGTDLTKAEELLEPSLLGDLNQDIAKLKQKLAEANQDAEELDELQALITDLDRKLEELLSSHRETLRKKLNTLILEVERASIALRSSTVLDREIQGQVAFVMHLNELRQSLLQKQRDLTDEFNVLKNNLTSSLAEAGGGPVTEMQQLNLALRDGEKEQKKLVEQQQAIETQIIDLQEWIKLLKDADQLFNTLSRLPDLRNQLTSQVVPEILAHLSKRRLEGLGDWEPFRSKVTAVEEELEKRRRHGNETFNSAKEEYEGILREMNIGDYRPRTRYTYGEDDGSYNDLHEEVKNKIEYRLDEITADLSREKTDLLKVQYINIVADENLKRVQDLHKQLSQAETDLQGLRKSLTIPLIKSGQEELNSFAEQIETVAQVIVKVRQQLGPVLHADHELDGIEKSIWQALGSRHEVDVTDLFVELRHKNNDLSLRDLLEVLEGLYRKNRLSIRIRPRG